MKLTTSQPYWIYKCKPEGWTPQISHVFEAPDLASAINTANAMNALAVPSLPIYLMEVEDSEAVVKQDSIDGSVILITDSHPANSRSDHEFRGRLG